MLARVHSAAVLGIDAYLVDIETDIPNGTRTLGLGAILRLFSALGLGGVRAGPLSPRAAS